jgi:hypothetical protein
MVFLVLTALLAGTGVPPAQGAQRSCANVRDGFQIAATNVSCTTARRVVSTWGRRARADGKRNRRVLGYSCRQLTSGAEGRTVFCRRGGRVIRFYPGIG